MLTTDLSLRQDPAYEKISRRFHENPDEFALAFAKAWYKLLHRDMGPVSRYLGPWVAEPQLWQDPVPAVDHELVDEADVAALKATLLDSGLIGRPARDDRVGLGGELPHHRQARRRQRRPAAARAAAQLGGQRARASWPSVLQVLERVQQEFNDLTESGGKAVSLADLIVLGGAAAVEKAARDAGVTTSPCRSPRAATDAPQEQTDVESFAVLEPRADGFRNYLRAGREACSRRRSCSTGRTCCELGAPEMTALVGGLRALGANVGGTSHGVLTDAPRDADQRLLRQPARRRGTEWKAS